MNSITILVIASAILCVVIYKLYLSLIQKKNKVSEAFYSIDVQLKKRYDLIPNILTIANKFMEHERSLMEEVTNLRTKAMNLSNSNINEKIKLDNEISKKMAQLMISVENYPQLKSDATMVSAIQTYNDVEEHIAAARRFYNSACLDLKNAVEIFPSSIIASCLGIKAVEFFKADEKEKQAISASEYLK